MRATFPTFWLTSAILSALLTSCGQPIQAPARPLVTRVFGIEQGQSLASLQQAHRIPLSVWGNDALVDYVFTPPEPDPAFAQYAAFVTAQHGVCQIKAQKLGAIGGLSTALSRKQFDTARKSLEAKYGPASTVLDRSVMWEKGSDSPSKLPKEISFISLDYNTVDDGISVTVNFSNFKDCTRDVHLKWTF
jgi:hypothetical protein